MPLSQEQFHELVRYVTQCAQTENDRKALVTGAFWGSPLADQVEMGGRPFTFATNMVQQAQEWGRLNEKQLALEALIDCLRDQFGPDHASHFDALIVALQTPNPTVPESAIPKPAASSSHSVALDPESPPSGIVSAPPLPLPDIAPGSVVAVQVQSLEGAFREGYWLPPNSNVESIRIQATELLQTHPGNSVALWALGVCAYRTGDVAMANENFQKAAETGTDDPRPLLWRGIVYAEQFLYEQAAEWFNQALTRHNDYIPVLFNIGVVRYTMQQYAQAEPPLRRAIALANECNYPFLDTVATLNDLHANTLFALGRGMEAEAAYQTAIAMQPMNGLFHADYALALFRVGRVLEARWQGQTAWNLGCTNHPIHQALLSGTWGGNPWGI